MPVWLYEVDYMSEKQTHSEYLASEHKRNVRRWKQFRQGPEVEITAYKEKKAEYMQPYMAKRRAEMTPEEYAAYREKQREYDRRYRAKKKAEREAKNEN